MRLFVTGTGTGIGKTWLTTGLVRHLTSRGRVVAGLKPIETGCAPEPEDARAIALAAGRPELANYPGFYRASLPLAPAAATAEGEAAPPSLAMLAEEIETAGQGADDLILEGAGGLLVPYDDEHDLIDLPRRLGLPILLVAPDMLGTLSHTRAAVEVARSRGVRILAIALLQPAPEPDHSASTNAELLFDRTALPVLRFGHRPQGPTEAELESLLRVLERHPD
ncbi:MAG: dethiobiotin synthase [Candidatus Eisenbacteria bacterium]|nr:dethiobiotin synthase [Candidatus Eisenbacteria bacterium]